MKIRKIIDKNILSMLILACFISVFFGITSYNVNKLAEKTCFNTLDDAATQVANDICTHVQADREQLSVIADLLTQHGDMDSETVKRHLSSFRQRGSLSAVGLLLSNNEMVWGKGEGKYGENFEYLKELEKIPYISKVEEMKDQSGHKFIYQAVPVRRDGLTVGILYGFVDLKDFAERITLTAFDNQAQLYVADGETGDFLVDTWHDTLGNVYDDNIAGRKVKSGYDYQSMKEDFKKGQSGHIAFWSNSAKEYFYSYYKPVGVESWMVQMTVPESVAFRNAIRIRKMIWLLAIAEIVSFLGYFLWLLSKVKRESAQKEQQLAQSVYMYDVQQTLFDAHKDAALIREALEKVAHMLRAQSSFLMAIKKTAVTETFSYGLAEGVIEKISRENEARHLFPEIFVSLITARKVILYPEEIRQMKSKKDAEGLKNCGVSSLMLVAVYNSSDELIGVLGTVNMAKHWKDITLLECVSRNFLMALSNIRSYRKIERMGMVDMLTGLQNRNCYEQMLDDYDIKKEESLCCLYMDVNGLHELNNTLGHAAGDEMLIFISNSLKMLFGHQNTYRIGGDEFVAFCENTSEREIQERINELFEKIESRGYHISLGQAWLKESFDIKNMLATAESRMYEAKRQYYQKGGNISKARVINQKLEQILLEKKDADAFLNIISSWFMGVYVVDMESDNSRVIYKPMYFSDILEENHYHFIPSMKEYIQKYVADDCRKRFLELLDYDKIRKMLARNHVVQYQYTKTDGETIILRIYPVGTESNDEEQEEILSAIWIFERNSNLA